MMSQILSYLFYFIITLFPIKFFLFLNGSFPLANFTIFIKHLLHALKKNIKINNSLSLQTLLWLIRFSIKIILAFQNFHIEFRYLLLTCIKECYSNKVENSLPHFNHRLYHFQFLYFYLKNVLRKTL